MIISAPSLFIDGAFTGPGALVVEAGVITEILGQPPVRADLVLAGGCLTPGLIDLHNNGAFGVDCATAGPAAWEVFIAGLAARGVTSVLPTIITAPPAEIHAAAARVAAAMANHPGILGLHLEGPFLNPAKRGAHRLDWLQTPGVAALDGLLADQALNQVLRVITLAPELPGAVAAIRRLAETAVVSLGHTAADAAQMHAAVAAGASMVTHVFTAQAPLVHRGPGAPGVPAIALTHPALHPCLIADGLHVHPAVLAIAFAACPRAIAVTDSVLIAGLPTGAAQEFGGLPVVLAPDGLARRPDGTVAGAAITLDEAVRRLIAAGVPPETAFAAATCRPADALRLADRGRIAIGARADLVWWGADYTVRRVWLAGATPGAAAPRRGTETARQDLHDLETRPAGEIVRRFLGQEAAALAALGRAADSLADLAEAVAAALAAGGRLFYAGAGTSGRLALLDAAECGPTFGLAEGVIIPLLAGGNAAFLAAAEGAEDDGNAAVAALQAHGFCETDALVGIAASGATPFTLAALRHAGAAGALTGAIVNNPGTPIALAATIAVVVDSGAEIIAGSTRLSAGTTQKIALNILSSTVMIRLGKTCGPYMVDLRASNQKLRRRAARITATLAGVPEAQAAAVLGQAEYQVKTAVVMLRKNLPAAAARGRLRDAGGHLRAALAD